MRLLNRVTQLGLVVAIVAPVQVKSIMNVADML